MLHQGKFKKFLINFVFFNLIFGLILLCLIHAMHNETQVVDDAIDTDSETAENPEGFISNRSEPPNQHQGAVSQDSKISSQIPPTRI